MSVFGLLEDPGCDGNPRDQQDPDTAKKQTKAHTVSLTMGAMCLIFEIDTMDEVDATDASKRTKMI